MSNPFPPWTNTLLRVTLFCLGGALVGGVGLLVMMARSPLRTHEREPVTQPLDFDHRHHVADDGIDCRYCHTTVETSASAGFPSTAVCMGCHEQVWNKSPLLDVIRRAYFTGEPLEWRKVHRLPDFVYFNHSIHVAKGVGCATCHGRVDQMAEIRQEAPLTMRWCLDCHRDPAPNLRPRELITSMTWQGDAVARHDLHTRTSCTTCHR
jgi:hypothetical protein